MDAASRVTIALVTPAAAIELEFEAGLAEWTRLAFRVAYSVVRQREDAEDIAQDVVAKAHRNLRQLRDRNSLRGWLVRMAWRMAIDRRESDRRRAAREDTAVRTNTPTAEDVAMSAERSGRLWQAIDSLPERLRLVVVLASIEGHALTEVAAVLDVPEGTVKSRLFEARQHLRERLQ
jgi:RNA polymerase sigma-70 factor (ECF subfamily)